MFLIRLWTEFGKSNLKWKRCKKKSQE